MLPDSLIIQGSPGNDCPRVYRDQPEAFRVLVIRPPTPETPWSRVNIPLDVIQS